MKKPSLVNKIIHHVTQVTAILLTFVWFGWKAGLIVFLISWSANTAKYDN